MTAVKQECIVASVESYRNKLTFDYSHMNHMYRMVTSCFHDNMNLTLVAKCQHPDTDALSDKIPVTSNITGYTYWNKPCAMCNDDDDDVIEWIPNVLIKTSIPYFSNSSNPGRIPYPDTYELLSSLLNTRRFSDIIYTPPVSIMHANHKCIRKDLVRVSECEQPLTEEGLSTSDWLLESCKQIYSPVQHETRSISPNIFCMVCRNSVQLIANKQSCRSRGPPKAKPGYLTALFNYKLEPEHPAPHAEERLFDGTKCNCAEMFDPYQKMCRPLYCAAGDIQAGCRCIQPFRNLTGMPVVLMAKVTAREVGPDSLTSGQLRKLQTALKGALETTAVNTYAEFATTLRQENVSGLTYLCIVIVRSDPGLDTKLAMRPFLRYLDTDDVLKLKVGKFDFAAALTTKARLWTEQDSTSGSFKACCLEQKPNSLVQVYASKETINSGNMGFGIYQSMSRLLYCRQLELDQTEHFMMNSAIVKINVTEPMIAISDYYPVSPSRVRVCADMYVQKAQGNGKKSVGVLWSSSVEIIISSLLSATVTYMIDLNW